MTQSESGPLLVVSNRLPYNLPRRSEKSPKRNVGGLVNAVEPVIASQGGCWIGWDGALLTSGSAVEKALASPPSYRTPAGVELVGVPLTDREVGRYYHGVSNRALWPLFHGFPGLSTFSRDDFAAYEKVNHRFAEVIFDRANAKSRVWIHDYHLMLVPLYLRELGYRRRIDFFLHIPFPPSEIFRVLPWRELMLRGLLAADTVALHIDLYRNNLVRSSVTLFGAEVEPKDDHAVLVRSDNRTTLALTSPIGTDVEEFERIARLPEVEARARKIRETHEGRRIIFGADRLDYTKGIQERVCAIERFLSMHPEWIGRIVLIQIVVPSRHQVEEYRALKREIDREVGRINGAFGREGWVPIHYRYVSLEREELVAHYLAADAALITPLRDGMNLVAAEFADARVDEDGVLIVSEFTGIAENAPGSLLVNPYDKEGCANAIARALTMSADERKERMRTLRGHIRENSLARWAKRCLETPARGTRKTATTSVRRPIATGPSSFGRVILPSQKP